MAAAHVSSPFPLLLPAPQHSAALTVAVPAGPSAGTGLLFPMGTCRAGQGRDVTWPTADRLSLHAARGGRGLCPGLRRAVQRPPSGNQVTECCSQDCPASTVWEELDSRLASVLTVLWLLLQRPSQVSSPCRCAWARGRGCLRGQRQWPPQKEGQAGLGGLLWPPQRREPSASSPCSRLTLPGSVPCGI